MSGGWWLTRTPAPASAIRAAAFSPPTTSATRPSRRTGVPTGSLLLSVGDFSYRDRRLLRARSILADIAARTGLSAARAAEVAALASDVTDGALGDGQWFTVLAAVKNLLPWGADVTVKNLVQNTPLLIWIMEVKSETRSVEGSEEGFGHDLGDLLNSYHSNYGEDDDSKYFNNVGHEEGGLEVMNCDELESRKVSREYLSNAYKNVLERIACLKEKGELGKDQGKKRRVGWALEVLIDTWEGRLDSDKKLTLEQVLPHVVG